MVYSRQRGIIFIKHIKVGGTSIQHYLASKLHLNAGRGDLMWGRPYRMIRHRGAQNLLMKEFAEKSPEIGRGPREHWWAEDVMAVIGEEQWRRCFSFAVERNPWDRLRSFWCMARTRPNEKLEFNEWVQFMCSMGRQDTGVGSNYMRNGNEVLVSAVFRYDHFHQGMRFVCDKIGIDYNPDDMPRKNAEYRKDLEPYQFYYDTKTRDLVQREFAPEIEMFGFSFDEPATILPPDAPIDTTNWYLSKD